MHAVALIKSDPIFAVLCFYRIAEVALAVIEGMALVLNTHSCLSTLLNKNQCLFDLGASNQDFCLPDAICQTLRTDSYWSVYYFSKAAE